MINSLTYNIEEGNTSSVNNVDGYFSEEQI